MQSLSEVLNEKIDLLLLDTYKGETFAGITQGKGMEKRILTAIQEEYSLDTVEVLNIEPLAHDSLTITVNNGIVIDISRTAIY